MDQVGKSVFVETKNRGSNCGFVVTSEGIVMIDVPVDPDHAQSWKKEMEKRGKIRCIINTEHHLDHWLFNSLYEVEIIAHEETRKTMLTMSLDYIRNRTKILYSEPLRLPDSHKLKVPTITYFEQATVYSGSHTFHLIHYPGHTLGQTAVYIPEEKVVFSGDNIFGQTMTAFHDALPGEWLDSLKVLEELDVDFIIPGHGKICDKSYLAPQAAVIRGYMEATNRAKAEGRTLDDAEKRKIDPYFDDLDVGIKPGLRLPPTSQR